VTSTGDECVQSNSPPRTPGAKKQKTWHYEHKYQEHWENDEDFKSWIGRSKKGNFYFYCKSCLSVCKGMLSAVKKTSVIQQTQTNFEKCQSHICF